MIDDRELCFRVYRAVQYAIFTRSFKECNKYSHFAFARKCLTDDFSFE